MTSYINMTKGTARGTGSVVALCCENYWHVLLCLGCTTSLSDKVKLSSTFGIEKSWKNDHHRFSSYFVKMIYNCFLFKIQNIFQESFFVFVQQIDKQWVLDWLWWMWPFNSAINKVWYMIYLASQVINYINTDIP